jgi:hypothetical protein
MWILRSCYSGRRGGKGKPVVCGHAAREEEEDGIG